MCVCACSAQKRARRMMYNNIGGVRDEVFSSSLSAAPACEYIIYGLPHPDRLISHASIALEIRVRVYIYSYWL